MNRRALGPRSSTLAAEQGGSCDRRAAVASCGAPRLCSVPVSSCSSVISLISITNQSTGHVRRLPVAVANKKLTVTTHLFDSAHCEALLRKTLKRSSNSQQLPLASECSHFRAPLRGLGRAARCCTPSCRCIACARCHHSAPKSAAVRRSTAGTQGAFCWQ